MASPPTIRYIQHVYLSNRHTPSSLEHENILPLLSSILTFLVAALVSILLSSGTAFWLLLIASASISAVEMIRYCIEEPKTTPHTALNFLRSSICASTIPLTLIQLFIQICRSSFGRPGLRDWNRHADLNAEDGSWHASTGALLGPLILIVVPFLMEGAVVGFAQIFPLEDWIYLRKSRRREIGGEGVRRG
jgi:hypothetical protein